MAKRDSKGASKVPSAGKPKKIVFGDDGVPDSTSLPKPPVSDAAEDDLGSSPGSDHGPEESDEDEAPEEIGTVAVRRAVQKEEKEAAALRRAAKQARSVKATATKTKKAVAGDKSTKAKGQDLAMEVERGAGDIEDSDEQFASEDELSFHTDSEGEDETDLEGGEGPRSPSAGSEDGDVDLEGSSDEEEDESEAFSEEDEESLDPETRRLRARMQAAMEAAESQENGAKASAVQLKSSAKDRQKHVDKGKKIAVSEEDDWAQFNMIPGVAPLPSSLLESARVAEERGKKAAKRKAEVDAVAERKMRKRKKIRREDDVVSRKIDGSTTVALLPPPPTSALSPSNIPRLTKARQDLAAQKKTSAFLREAMKRSGTSKQTRPVAGKGQKVKDIGVPLGGGRVPGVWPA